MAFATWQHALFDPEGFSARIIRAAVGAERFLAAYRAPRSWRRCSCLVPPAPEEENEAQKRRGFFGLFKRGEHVEKEATKEEARGGGLFGMFKRGEHVEKEATKKEARGGGLFGLFRGGKDDREEDNSKV